MRRGFKCRNDVFVLLKTAYDKLVEQMFGGSYLDAIEQFETISEQKIRPTLCSVYYDLNRASQAWKSCKGSLYEYAFLRLLQQVLKNNPDLKHVRVVDEGNLSSYKNQIVIKNWTDIIPDADILLIRTTPDGTHKVCAIFSCKTSLRERLTETAFWKREYDRQNRDIKFVLVTTDKDDELRTDTNRYIILHVLDYVIITDPKQHSNLTNTYKIKYGHKKSEIDQLLKKLKPPAELPQVLRNLATPGAGEDPEST